jgi:ribonuclease toxin BrnT of type II toxin-antitoxin system
MDCNFEHHGTTFVWDRRKAAENERRHGVKFEEAATVFDDPLFVVKDASRNDEQRDAVIGFQLDRSTADGRACRMQWRVHPNHFSMARFGGRRISL